MQNTRCSGLTKFSTTTKDQLKNSISTKCLLNEAENKSHSQVTAGKYVPPDPP